MIHTKIELLTVYHSEYAGWIIRCGIMIGWTEAAQPLGLFFHYYEYNDAAMIKGKFLDLLILRKFKRYHFGKVRAIHAKEE